MISPGWVVDWTYNTWHLFCREGHKCNHIIAESLLHGWEHLIWQLGFVVYRVNIKEKQVMSFLTQLPIFLEL